MPPYLTFNFAVEIEGLLVGGFTEVTGLESQIEVEEYREGGVNDFVRKLPGKTTYANLVLRHGLTGLSTLWDWYNPDYRGGDPPPQRYDHAAQRHPGSRSCGGNFRNALPVRWTGPTFNAASDEVGVEELELVHEGFHHAVAEPGGRARAGHRRRGYQVGGLDDIQRPATTASSGRARRAERGAAAEAVAAHRATWPCPSLAGAGILERHRLMVSGLPLAELLQRRAEDPDRRPRGVGRRSCTPGPSCRLLPRGRGRPRPCCRLASGRLHRRARPSGATASPALPGPPGFAAGRPARRDARGNRTAWPGCPSGRLRRLRRAHLSGQAACGGVRYGKAGRDYCRRPCGRPRPAAGLYGRASRAAGRDRTVSVGPAPLDQQGSPLSGPSRPVAEPVQDGSSSVLPGPVLVPAAPAVRRGMASRRPACPRPCRSPGPLMAGSRRQPADAAGRGRAGMADGAARPSGR